MHEQDTAKRETELVKVAEAPTSKVGPEMFYGSEKKEEPHSDAKMVKDEEMQNGQVEKVEKV